MDKKDKGEILEMFSEAFHEVVPPLLEDVMKPMEERLSSDIGRVERKLDAQQDRLDRHGKQIENHEKRITKVELKVGVSPS